MLSLNDVRHYAASDANRALTYMIESSRQPAKPPSEMLYGPPEPVEFVQDDGGDDDDSDADTEPGPPIVQNRLAGILGATHD